jgi:hypothetical protein
MIVPDRKTPTSVAHAAEDARRAGFDVRCPTLDEQERFLRRLGTIANLIPYDSDNRRNIGFLMALDLGCDLLVSIDDDNYCRSDTDFVGEHSVVGTTGRDPQAASSDGWFNLCSLLTADTTAEVFPRGFPYYARRQNRRLQITDPSCERVVAINAGLWLDDPDVDAISRLSLNPKTGGMDGKSLILAPQTWSPINTQNTALLREAVASYYYVRMGYPLKGLKIDRFGDILSGYFVQKCTKQLGRAIRIGTPVADHVRTPHNLFKDLYDEFAGIVLLEELLPWLIEEPLEGSTYPETYHSLAERISAGSSRFHGFVWDDGGREFLTETAAAMKSWLAAVKTIESSSQSRRVA